VIIAELPVTYKGAFNSVFYATKTTIMKSASSKQVNSLHRMLQEESIVDVKKGVNDGNLYRN
jgi:hypothetical protein